MSEMTESEFTTMSDADIDVMEEVQPSESTMAPKVISQKEKTSQPLNPGTQRPKTIRARDALLTDFGKSACLASLCG